MVSLIGAALNRRPATMHYETASATRRGDRHENQDRCAVLEDGTATLLMLADGMGGHARGELAAGVFIDSLASGFRAHRHADAAAFLRQAFARAHANITSAGLAASPPADTRTTGVACLVTGNRACWAHVGDSRLYLLRGDTVLARTTDHSYVEELIQLGELAEADRERHPLRNYVTRALGGGSQPPAATVSAAMPLQPGDVLLLCSDGLWSALADECLFDLAHAASLQACADRLVEEAETRSTPLSDNISLVALRTRDG